MLKGYTHTLRFCQFFSSEKNNVLRESTGLLKLSAQAFSVSDIDMVKH